MAKHFIEIDNNNNVIEAFSDAFVSPNNNSILVEENGNRHFNLDVTININGFSFYQYKYADGELIKKSLNEILLEITLDQKIKKVIKLKNTLLLNTIWIQQRHYGEEYAKEKGIGDGTCTLTEEQFEEWLLYWRDLRDLEQNIDLTNISYDEIVEENRNIFPEPPIAI